MNLIREILQAFRRRPELLLKVNQGRDRRWRWVAYAPHMDGPREVAQQAEFGSYDPSTCERKARQLFIGHHLIVEIHGRELDDDE